MSSARRRVLVYLKNGRKRQAPVLAEFSQCILDYFEETGLVAPVHVRLHNNAFILSNEPELETTPVYIKHPSFCPVHHFKGKAELPPHIQSKGVNVAAVTLLESSDSKILLTKRARHLRMFPGIWVLPGGHIEEKETVVQTALRELKEETGLGIAPEECQGGLQLLALWESVFPPKLQLGNPVDHHIIVFLHGKLKSNFTAERLSGKINMDPNEVEACAWLDKRLIQGIVAADEDHLEKRLQSDGITGFLSASVFKGKYAKKCSLPTRVLLQTAYNECGRVSTGTKFGLEWWLCKQ